MDMSHCQGSWGEYGCFDKERAAKSTEGGDKVDSQKAFSRFLLFMSFRCPAFSSAVVTL